MEATAKEDLGFTVCGQFSEKQATARVHSLATHTDIVKGTAGIRTQDLLFTRQAL